MARYKMDYGGHDTVLEGNLFWQEGGDGQDCFNTGGFLPGHGCVYRGNKCMLPDKHLLGHVSGCDCPGGGGGGGDGGSRSGSSDSGGSGSGSEEQWMLASSSSSSPPLPSAPAAQCGVSLSSNSYFGFAANLTVDCGGSVPLSFTEWQARGSDAQSRAYMLPTDEGLLYMARQTIGMPLPPGPAPEPPAPLPPAPPPSWPQTCSGDCHRAHHCCASPLVSGCESPTCVIGCEIAKHSGSRSECEATCKRAAGQCSFKIAKNVTVEQCSTCTNDPQCNPQVKCEDEKTCEEGCGFAFNHRTRAAKL